METGRGNAAGSHAMAQRVSPETKKDVVWDYHDGIPAHHVAEHHGVSEGSVYRWYRRWHHQKVRVFDDQDMDYPLDITRRVWTIFDYGKGRYVGETYRTEAEAHEAVYEYL